MTATAFVPAFVHPPVYSPWFDLAAQAPWEPGLYEVQLPPGFSLGPDGTPEHLFSWWDGAGFRFLARLKSDALRHRDLPGLGHKATRWRGIIPPSRLPRFVSETLPEARRRVPALLGLPSGSRAVHVFEAVDCMPGYDLMCSVPLEGEADKPLFIYRRRDPSCPATNRAPSRPYPCP